MEKYGFVYIWRDRKHKRFYIGCHWGTEDDGYICSSSWMKKAYKYRPEDFKRKIVAKIYSNRKDTFDEEQKWLNLIEDVECGKKYYNLCKNAKYHYMMNEDNGKSSIEKMRNSLLNRNSKMTVEERKEKFGTRLGSTNVNKGKTFEEIYGIERATKLKDELRQANLGKKYSEETKAKRRGRPSPMKGKTHSDEARQKISQAQKGTTRGTKKKIGDKNKINTKSLWQNDEYRKKMVEVHTGKVTSEETKIKMRESHRKAAMNNRKISLETIQKIKECRETQGLTYDALADIFSISKTHVARIITTPNYGRYDNVI